MATADPWGRPFAPGFPCIDAHVHLHPPRLAQAIERHFARERWLHAHPFEPAAVAATLAARGVTRFCFFTYAHKAGMARDLNRWVAATAAGLPGAVGLGTLHPDDPDVDAVAREATDALGLRGFKFHLSVQRFAADDPRLASVYARAEAEGHRLVLHAGTMPYRDPFTGVEPCRRLLARFPRLRVCVAHMGHHEPAAFAALLADHPGLHLDTTMSLAASAAPYVGAEPAAITDAFLVEHQDRILFGSDFPLIPYDYDDERRWAWERDLPPAVRRKIFHDNAVRFLGLG